MPFDVHNAVQALLSRVEARMPHSIPKCRPSTRSMRPHRKAQPRDARSRTLFLRRAAGLVRSQIAASTLIHSKSKSRHPYHRHIHRTAAFRHAPRQTPSQTRNGAMDPLWRDDASHRRSSPKCRPELDWIRRRQTPPFCLASSRSTCRENGGPRVGRKAAESNGVLGRKSALQQQTQSGKSRVVVDSKVRAHLACTNPRRLAHQLPKCFFVAQYYQSDAIPTRTIYPRIDFVPQTFLSSNRYPIASLTSSNDTSSRPATSAIVRATRRILS